jgi:CheY-like chemotaxis protein
MRFAPDHPDPATSGGGRSRLNLLFSSSWREGVPTAELPRLLDPLGVRCLEARCGREAARIVEQEQVHIALVDLEMPMEPAGDRRPAGHQVLQLLRRMDPAPPVVLVRPPQVSRRESVRGLNDALREGVFAVLDRPLGLEPMLETLRRVVRRHYADRWPAA